MYIQFGKHIIKQTRIWIAARVCVCEFDTLKYVHMHFLTHWRTLSHNHHEHTNRRQFATHKHTHSSFPHRISHRSYIEEVNVSLIKPNAVLFALARAANRTTTRKLSNLEAKIVAHWFSPIVRSRRVLCRAVAGYFFRVCVCLFAVLETTRKCVRFLRANFGSVCVCVCGSVCVLCAEYVRHAGSSCSNITNNNNRRQSDIGQ